MVASDTPENLERNLGDSDLIEIETKADPDEVRRILETVDGIRSISTKHLENGITWAQIQEKKNTDVREKVFQAFAQNHQPLLKLNPLQVSLEDVFMELTQSDRAAEEYAEKAKEEGNGGHERCWRFIKEKYAPIFSLWWDACLLHFLLHLQESTLWHIT